MSTLIPSLSSQAARVARTAAVALALVAGMAAPASAQILIDDFNNGIGPGEFVFGAPGFEAGTLGTTDTGGGDLVATFFADADEYGGYTGFGQPIEGGPLDITGLTRPVVQFDLLARGSFQLELNLQNTGGGGNGEIRAVLQIQLPPNVEDAGLRTYRIPLEAFLPTNAATFDADDVAQYVWTIVNATADGDPSTLETGVVLDNVQLIEGYDFSVAANGEDFDSGDFSDSNGYFYYSGGEGLTASATADTPDGSPNAFKGAIDGDEYGGYVGFGRTFVGAPFDITSQETVNFYLRANGSALMEFNIQTDAAAGGDQQQGREVIRVSDTGMQWVPFSIPVRALVQASAAAPDFVETYNFAITFVELAGDGDPGTTEFMFEIDGITFGSSNAVAVGELPPSLSAAPVAFPNPTAGGATVAFELASAQAVSVDVYDLLGRRLATLAEGPMSAGPARLAVPAASFAPGVYVVRVRTEDGVASTRLTVLR